jgi:hypothetical protein
MIGHRFVSALLASLALFFANGAFAAPEDEAKTLYEKGVDEYDNNLDFDAARTAFEKALVVIARNPTKVSGTTVAQIKIRAGVLYIAVDKDAAKGKEFFISALKADPTAKVDPSLSNPEIDKVFKEAKVAAGVVGTTSTPPVKPTVSGPILLSHKPPREATTGTPFRIRVELPEGMQAAKVYAKYRAPGQTKFVELPLESLAANAYQANIPSEKLKKGSLEYYISAEDADGKTLGLSGSSDAPHLVQITSEGEDPTPISTKGNKGKGKGKNVDPDADPDPETPDEPEPDANPKRIFSLIVSGGMIAGTVAGKTDVSKTPVDNGFSLPDAVVMPELAFYVTPRLTLGAIGLIQVTNTAGALEAPESVKAGGGLRVRYFHGHLDGFRPFFSGDGGFGQFVQHFPTNFQGNALGKDSTHNVGPFVGLGWGFENDFTKSVALMVNASVRGYLADNKVSGAEDVPVVQTNLAIGIRVGK